MVENRMAGPNFVRAAACVTVVMHHAVQRIDPAALPGELRAWLLMGGFRVGAFFVLSGFLLSIPFWKALDSTGRPPSLRTFALRRIARVLPAYWVALTVSFVLSITLFGLPYYDDLGIRFVSGLLFVSDWHWLTFFPVEHNGPLWAISFEVTCYVLMPVFFAVLFVTKMRGWLAVGLWAAMVGVLIVVQLLIVTFVHLSEANRGWEYGYPGGAKAWMPYFNPVALFAIFAVGVLAAGAHQHLQRRDSVVFDGLAVAGAVLAAIGMAVTYPVEEGYGLARIPFGFPLFPLGICLVLVGISRSTYLRRVTEVPPIPFVARISFGIYLWHFLLMDVVLRLLVPDYGIAGMTSLWRWAATTAGVVAAAVVIATVSYYSFEKPIMAWARRFEATSPAGSAAK